MKDTFFLSVAKMNFVCNFTFDSETEMTNN